jgi:hypothetical protein
MATLPIRIRGGQFPGKDWKPTPENIHMLDIALTSFMAGHTGATETYTFYEVLNQYMGWDDKSYPIAYGKYYNILFTQDPILKENEETKDWVWRTTILLQQALSDFVMQRFRAGTLASLTEPELRKAAFDSHPTVYTQAGLAKVLMLAPYLLPLVAAIPYKEYTPVNGDWGWNENFTPTVKQVFIAAGMTGMVTFEVGMAAIMPAHSGFLRNAAAVDQRNLMREMSQGRELQMIRSALTTGACDNIVWLNKITDQLNRNQYPDQRFAHAAQDVVELVNLRKHKLAAYYRIKLSERPDLRPYLDRTQPGWDRW